MGQETKICQNCKKEFIIEAEDFAFYEKIKVPTPTWCPQCRLIRRMVWRNERIFYKRKCDLCHQEIISMYSQNVPFPVYCPNCWWSDKWDSMKYGQDFDFNKTFLEQLNKLYLKIPKIALYQKANINSPWVNRENNSKNCYLNVGGFYNEDCAYNTYAIHSKDVLDSLMFLTGELSYWDIFCFNCYKVFFSQFCFNCQETYFSFNCRNCSNIIGCTNLNSKSYYIFNKAVAKEEYKRFLEKYSFGEQSTIDFLRKESERVRLLNPHKFNLSIMAVNCEGDFIEKSKNCKCCFNVKETEDCRYIYVGGMIRDCWDSSSIGTNNQLSYEFITGGVDSSSLLFSNACSESHDLFYCLDIIENSSNLFGCVGLRNKEYCILNKQYTKEEYQEMVPKIIEQMNKLPYRDKKGRTYSYGEFFPPELSPFSYNETVAQEYFPLTKEQALEQGYTWKDPEERNIQIEIKNEDLPDHIKDVKDDIIGKVIECQHKGQCNEQCTQGFKIIPQELDFYRKMNLPLPRLCPNCRHYQRLKQRNPLKLWSRKCMCHGKQSTNKVYTNTTKHFHGDQPCPNTFQTSYSPERPEIVYCEECYKREVG